MKYSRIAIIGGPGTGKTTLAKELSNIYNLPVTHIDGIHHLANWNVRDKVERDKLILDIVKKEKWIIEGTYISFSFLQYVFKYNKEKRKNILNNIEGIDQNKIRIFKNQKYLNQWLNNQKEKLNEKSNT